MESVFKAIEALQRTSIPNLLFLLGGMFLLLAFVGKIGATIELPERRQKMAGVIGALLVVVGIILSLPIDLSSLRSRSESNPGSQPAGKGPDPSALPHPSEGIGISPNRLLADRSLIPSDLSQHDAGSNSNEETSRPYENPGEIFSFLENSKRVNNYYNYRRSNDYCDVNGEIKSIRSTAHRFDTVSNAIYYFKISNERRKSNLQGTVYEEVRGVGEKAVTLKYEGTDKNNCSPVASRITVYALSFQRYNIYGAIYISVIAGNINEQNIQSLRIKLAHSMDVKIMQAAKQK
jgi:hypothetical protein